jgi:signal transduction histidine kinase
VFDGALAAGLAVLGAAEAAAYVDLRAEAVVLAEVAVLPVVFRRVAPVAAALCVAVVLLVASGRNGWPDTFSVFAALLAVTFALGEVGRVAGAPVVLVLVLVAVGIDSDELVPDLAFPAVVLVMAWGAGRAVGVHRRRTAELRGLAASLERERGVGARLAVREERARLTGDVHDAVGHTVAAMLAQAEAAHQVLARDPARARHALDAVQSSGRAVIDQLRVTLRVLRSDDDEHRLVQSVDAPVRPPHCWCWPAPAEAALLGAVAALWVVEIVWFPYPEDGSKAISLALATMAIAGLSLRARAPLTAAGLVGASSLADDLLGGVWYDGLTIVVALLLVLFALGTNRVRARAVAGGLIVVGLVVADELFGAERAVMDAPFVAIICAIPWTAGWVVRRHRDQAKKLSELARELDCERRASARLAVLAERTHMARELHDSVAHGVSVMVVQAAAAEQASRLDPRAAEAAIDAVGRTGRDVLADLQRLLGLFELDQQSAPRSQQPSLAEIDELVARVRDAGLPVTLRIEGTPRPVRSEIAGSAFRIVQEALTNVLKHAGRPATAVVVRYRPDTLDLAVDDDGSGAASAPSGTGHGVIGMRERAALTGGELRAGPRAAGRFSVHARLPFDGGAG